MMNQTQEPKPPVLADVAPVKSVQWSYPTSDNARRFGHRFTGCWTVEIIEYDAEGLRLPPVAIEAYQMRKDAMASARTLPNKWDSIFLRFYPEESP